MERSPATPGEKMTTNALDLATLSNRAALTLSTPLPQEELARLELRAIDQYLLLDSEGSSPMALRVQAHLDTLLPGGLGAWVEVGRITEDMSGWDECEGKWEYHYRDDVVFARREELEAAIDAQGRAAARVLTWKPFAGLGA